MRIDFIKPSGCSRRVLASRVRPSSTLTTLCFGLALLWAPGVQAQTPSPTPQFDVLGFIQEAAVDPTVCTPADPRLAGGWMKVNGHKLIVPCNSIVQMPAAAFTWADLFDPTVSVAIGTTLGTTAAQQAVNQSKLALADNPVPFPSFEVRATGNIVPDPAVPGGVKYVVGMIVPITQQGLNAGAGIISFIDYTSGAFRVGGVPGDPNCTQGVAGTLQVGGGPLCSGTLVQINDPLGRYGKVHSPDQRFTADTANPTITHSTGYPACIARVAPPAIDPECPLYNRPPNGSSFGTDPFLAAGAPLKNFMMPAPGTTVCAGVTTCPDPLKQAPLMVGDYVTFAGTLTKLNPAATILGVFMADPVTGLPIGSIPLYDSTAANTYISAHTLNANTGIFTQPGIAPAYLRVEDILIGTNGAAQAAILQEASTRLTVVGFTTDPTRLVDINAIDVNPCSGDETFRLLATVDPATDAIVGRFVYRVLGGAFMPPTREYQVKSKTQVIDPLTLKPVDFVAANGLLTGQFRLPNFEYIFPENHKLGDPTVANNFQDLPFLAYGSGRIVGATGASVQVGQLNPWPGAAPYNAAPAPPNCSILGANPILTVQPTLAVSTNSQVQLTGTIAWDANSVTTSRTAVWAQVPTPGAPTVSLSPTTLTPINTSSSTASASFLAPSTATALSFSLTATDNLGTTSAIENISVVAGGDIVQIPAGTATWLLQRGQRGGFGKLNVTATSSNPAATLTLFELGTDGSITDWGTGATTVATPGTYNWIELKGAPQPASLTVRSNLGGSATVTCSAPDAKGRVTCP